ncbi:MULTISPECIES: HIT family protein [unclassified Thermoplasma]|uniref:HIT family protein n=1 Tax=unclassified Thermoplasma TaxID=2684908 RepID=UPI000D8729D1|nr:MULTISPECIES: HIT family protein [unclassified Thermoplasma]PYB67883.1 HIT family protein [Thermoplasma sp. Kam2015]
MVLDDSCVFCKEIIIKRNAAIVAENDMVISFMDNAPVEPGHILVIPKEHFENIFDIDQRYYIEVQLMAKRVAKAVMKAMGADGINIGQNNGSCANQRVMHFHVHVIPRWCDKPFKWGRLEVSFEDLQRTAQKIAGVYSEMERNHDFD